MAKSSSFEEGMKNAAEAMRVAGFHKGKAAALEKVDIVGRLAEYGAFIENTGE